MADSQQTTASDGPAITVYWLNESRADRILFLMEELEVPYAIEKFDRGADKLAPAALKKIHPLGKSPVIKDGDQVVAESGFIIDYLVDKYGQEKHLKPTNKEDLFQYNYVSDSSKDNSASCFSLQYLHYIEGTLMPILVMKYIFANLQQQAPWIVKPVVNAICNKFNALYLGPNIRVHLDFLEGELGKRKWLAGDQFSGADIQVVLLRSVFFLIASILVGLGKFCAGDAGQTWWYQWRRGAEYISLRSSDAGTARVQTGDGKSGQDIDVSMNGDRKDFFWIKRKDEWRRWDVLRQSPVHETSVWLRTRHLAVTSITTLFFHLMTYVTQLTSLDDCPWWKDQFSFVLASSMEFRAPNDCRSYGERLVC